ncbi:tetratricopeptide repeat protein [Chlorobium ferrooxidans]|uniref:TPR repeat:Tetratricopeptide TPR_3 n=1 Tax=Chlorobium ferrooxidans DSM 13031 TaxID=377431 RepID=Q0YU86_9CHLB|nr:tetratricopeptide repeat protein [Chlorobium ferrooxidans]EAT59669.1 TPR repeat:Tetratricopeptide TPR_3 [Chlorobium ferrooxidans DSM 13031]
MIYQLSPLLDEYVFEKLVRDILRRVYDDPGIECFGRKGQSQYGIDGFSSEKSGVTFQCKLKDTRFRDDGSLRDILSVEMENELVKTQGLQSKVTRFIFASTFKNDSHLQQKAQSLSRDTLTVEYWGWDTITEKLWRYRDELLPTYYPDIPAKSVPGFREITSENITDAYLIDGDERKELALDYYRINDRDDVVFKVVCNGMDVRNDIVMQDAFHKLENLPGCGSLWIVGNGGCGKTTILNRLAVELVQSYKQVYLLDLEAQLERVDIEHILNYIKFTPNIDSCLLCIDNPAANEDALKVILRHIPELSKNIRVLLAERGHRYHSMKQSGCLTFIHGEEEREPVVVRNSRNQRRLVYSRLFKLLGLSENLISELGEIVLNESIVYVNATYRILLELKKKRLIDYDFDWDDYRKSTHDLPAFRDGYRYIALFYLMGVKSPFEVFARVSGADEPQKRAFLSKFRGLQQESIIVTEWRDDLYKKHIFLRTKHEIISEIYFLEHPEINKNELMVEWFENTYFDDIVESQALVNVFGAKKNYFTAEAYLDFEYLINFLLKGHIAEEVKKFRKLFETLHLAHSWTLLSHGNDDGAAEVLLSALNLMPNNLHTRTELAKIYQRQDKLEEAEVVLKKLLDIDKNNLMARTELAKIYQRQDKLEEAEVVLKKLLDIDKNNLMARTELAKIYQRQDKLEEAEVVLKESLAIDSKQLHPRTELAKIYQRQDKLEEAEVVLKESLAIDSKQLHPRTELAKIYQRQDKLEEAEVVLKEILDISPKDLNSRTELAKIYQRQDKLEEAEVVLKEILDISPKDLNSRTELAKIYQRQDKLEEAEVVLKKLLDIDKNNLMARTELAKIYQRQDKLEEAEVVLQEILDISPKDLNSRTELAKIYQRQDKLEEAEVVLKESLAIDSKQLHPRTELAKIYQRQDKLEEAEVVLKESLAIDSKQLHPRTELAKIYQRQDKLEEAEVVLKKLLDIDKNNLMARTELAKIYQRQDKLEEAEVVLKESLAIDSKQLHPRTELAKIYQRQDKLEEAEVVLKESLAIDSKQLHPRTELAKIYQRQDKLEEAEVVLKESLAIDPINSYAMSELLGVLRKQKKVEFSSRFLKFICQPQYRFGHHSQASVFRFLLCCRDFHMKTEAEIVFDRFGKKFDAKNRTFYEQNFI